MLFKNQQKLMLNSHESIIEIFRYILRDAPAQYDKEFERICKLLLMTIDENMCGVELNFNFMIDMINSFLPEQQQVGKPIDYFQDKKTAFEKTDEPYSRILNPSNLR